MQQVAHRVSAPGLESSIQVKVYEIHLEIGLYNTVSVHLHLSLFLTRVRER